MQGHSAGSYAQLRDGSEAGNQWGFFKQQAGYRGVQKGQSLNAGSQARMGSGPFIIESDTIKTGEVASIDKNRLGSAYGANSASSSSPTPPTPGG